MRSKENTSLNQDPRITRIEDGLHGYGHPADCGEANRRNHNLWISGWGGAGTYSLWSAHVETHGVRLAITNTGRTVICRGTHGVRLAITNTRRTVICRGDARRASRNNEHATHSYLSRRRTFIRCGDAHLFIRCGDAHSFIRRGDAHSFIRCGDAHSFVAETHAVRLYIGDRLTANLLSLKRGVQRLHIDNHAIHKITYKAITVKQEY